ncbi:unnamed protein product [Bursaphelenchus xylophilus]|uniref:(pine wood nematode) hypothetical protein n=1 Tax=Bursaphelenchus xylophilus TaxID=6326 RepID=A0A1I7RII7_BURXY|nr:unnamed protein product [Bursaphelenchus xylophilus]CAG9080713.1 unnamed protein product [Bursaphelenchus xylophilus]
MTYRYLSPKNGWIRGATPFERFKMIAKTLLLLTTTLFVGTDAFGFLPQTQSAGARGKLLCNGKPAVGVQVKLWNDAPVDDPMGQTVTDSNGTFLVYGHSSEFFFGNISPKINIDHECEDNWPCNRRIRIYIPETYVNEGDRVKRFYDAGVIELSGKFAGEERDCLN